MPGYFVQGPEVIVSLLLLWSIYLFLNHVSDVFRADFFVDRLVIAFLIC